MPAAEAFPPVQIQLSQPVCFTINNCSAMLVLRGLCEQKLLTKVSGECRAQHKGRDTIDAAFSLPQGCSAPFTCLCPKRLPQSCHLLITIHGTVPRAPLIQTNMWQGAEAYRVLVKPRPTPLRQRTQQILLFRGQSCRSAHWTQGGITSKPSGSNWVYLWWHSQRLTWIAWK